MALGKFMYIIELLCNRGNKIHKNILIVVGITILFLGTCITPSFALDKINYQSIPISSGNTLYVGGTGPGNYTKIQDAIDAASDGYTIKVYNGIYQETVDINKRINLIGKGSSKTIIDGNFPDHKHVVYITKNGVNMTGFGVKNSYMGHEYGGIGIQSTNNRIYDNYFYNNLYGAILFGGNNKLYKNTFSYNEREGIFIKSSGNIIDNNTCSNSYDRDGIWLYICSNNIISNNICNNNYKNGISLFQSINNSIINNSCTNNILYDGILVYQSSNNKISNNKLTDNNEDGIGVNYYSNNNIFYSNIVSYNQIGINIIGNSGLNEIYHNNLIFNTQNAYDTGENDWNDHYPSGGNYWDNYNGQDNDGDGIGDIAYKIRGGFNKDNYPLINPWGENPPITDFIFNIEELKVLFDASSSYDRDGEIISYDWDFGDGTNDEGKIVYHKYCEVGYYDVTLTVTDDDGLTDNISKYNIEIPVANTPPEIEIYGQNQGKPGIEYEYVFIVIDPDGDENFVYIDWGDGSHENWMRSNGSGNPLNISHSWDKKGTYIIKAKVKDDCVESEWAEFEVTIPRSRSTYCSLFYRFLELFPLLERLLILIRNG